MHHTIAWRLSTTTAVETDLTPVPDGLMLIQNGHYVPQFDYNLLYAYAGAASINSARFVTPWFRQMTSPWIRPVNPAIVPGDEPNFADYSKSILTFKALEEIQLLGTQTSGGGAIIAGTAGIMRQALQPMPAANVYTMRGTGATTVTAGAWSLCPITWQDTLPAGLYACVGLEAIGATCLAGRLIFEEQWERPGCIGASGETTSGIPLFRKGGLGIWGRFNANRMPNIEFLCNAADTAQQVFLDFVRVG